MPSERPPGPRHALESHLRSFPGIRDCVALDRGSGTDADWVAYLVPTEPAPPAALEQLWARAAAGLPAPCSAVFVAGLPLDGSGGVDAAALARLPAIDAAACAELEAELSALPGVEEAAVVCREHRPEVPRLHVARLPGSPSPARRPPRPVQRPSAGPRRPAQVSGEPLETPADYPATLPDALLRAARRPLPAGVCHIEPGGGFVETSYAELLDRARRGATLLRSRGVAAGRPILLQIERSRELLPALWACLLSGALPVPVTFAGDYRESNAGTEKLERAWHLFDRPPVLAGNEVRPRVERWARSRGLAGFECFDLAAAGEAGPADDLHRPDPEDVALVMLTSGSTGEPKGVMLRHRNVLSRTLGKTRYNGLGPEEVSLNWMPLDHVGGIVAFHLRDVILGARQIHAPTEPVLRDPLTWLDWVDRHRVTVTWAPNFAFGLVNERAAEARRRSWDLSCLRFIVNGGEPIVPRTGRRFLELLAPHGLPPGALHPTWGQAEASSGITYSRTFRADRVGDDDALVEVGGPIPGVELRVVDEGGRLLEEGEIGRIQVRGPTVMAGYYARPERTRETIDPEGWLETGDLGFLREARLTVTGRHKETIVVNGANFYCHEIEATVEEVEGVLVSWTAACAVSGAGGERLAIFFGTDLPSWEQRLELVRRIREAVVRRVGLRPDYVVPLPREEIPKTAIGKIQRTLLRERFESGELAAQVADVELREGGRNTLPAWFFEPRWQPLNVASSQPLPIRRRLVVGGGGLIETLHPVLSRAGGAALALAGEGCERLGIGRYRLDPADDSAWRQVLESLAGEGLAPEEIVYLAAPGVGAGREPELRPGHVERELGTEVAPLLALARALGSDGVRSGAVRLLVAGAGARRVAADDPVRPAKALLPALLRTLALETPGLACRYVDVPPAETADAVLAELASPTGEAEVAWRRGRRWVPCLAAWEPQAGEAEAPLLRRGGAFLVSGGLGGVGEELSAWLLERWGARLLLVGRTAREELARDHRRDSLERLRSLGDVEYAAADVADAAAVERAVAQAEERWGQPLGGAFHLAGTFRRRRLADETAETLASAAAAKAAGAAALLHVLERRGDGFLVAFSSVAAELAEPGLGAYAAANAFLDALPFAARERQIPIVRTIAWSAWSGLGMSRGVDGDRLARTSGFLPMPVEAALASLAAFLHADRPALLVGLDPAHPAVRTAARRGDPLSVPQAYWSGGRDTPLPPLSIRDRFGTSTPCPADRLAALPRTPRGDVDRERLAGSESARERPSNPLERAVAACWSEVLERADLAPESHFFELGGDSLLGVRLLNGLRRELGVELTLRDLFSNPTVAAQAALVEQRRGSLAAAADAPGPLEAAALLERLDSLSDDEVERLLGTLENDGAGGAA